VFSHARSLDPRGLCMYTSAAVLVVAAAGQVAEQRVAAAGDQRVGRRLHGVVLLLLKTLVALRDGAVVVAEGTLHHGHAATQVKVVGSEAGAHWEWSVAVAVQVQPQLGPLLGGARVLEPVDDVVDVQRLPAAP